MVVASRPGEPGSERELLARLAEGPDVDVVRRAGLSADAVGAVVRGRFAVEADEALVAEITAATGGTPLLLRELVRTLPARDAPPSAAVREAVPSSVTRSVARRLERLDHDARRVARAAPVLGEGRSAELLAREHLSAGRERPRAVDAGALLARATDELTVAGGRPRRIALTGVEALTPSERRVAEHAASGLSNREIAEALHEARHPVAHAAGRRARHHRLMRPPPVARSPG